LPKLKKCPNVVVLRSLGHHHHDPKQEHPEIILPTLLCPNVGRGLGALNHEDHARLASAAVISVRASIVERWRRKTAFVLVHCKPPKHSDVISKIIIPR
jgi:hypothetical protein